MAIKLPRQSILKCSLCLLLVLLGLKADAQFVTIPDSGFVKFLKVNYPGCMNGNQMDTTCADILKEDFLNLDDTTMMNLEGLQYFDSVTLMNIMDLKITSLPGLPPRLLSLAFHYNYLIPELPPLPSSLISLDVAMNGISELPPLPNSLEALSCDFNNLTWLPPLSDSLTVLACRNNAIRSIPPLPGKLLILAVGYNELDSLPALPESLIQLDCNNNNLKQLPILSHASRLYTLICPRNNLSGLPDLPVNLSTLLCDSNQLVTLPALPSRLRSLNCNFNQLQSIPALPNVLEGLACEHNKITELPALPLNGQYSFTLLCSYNLLTKLPPIPSKIWVLECRNNLLTEFPQLIGMPIVLDCSNNKITCFKTFPDNKIYGNPTVNLSNNPFQCLPNYLNGMDSMSLSKPLCSYDESGTNNPYGCPLAKGITGRVYIDSNTNCQYDSSERSVKQFPVVLRDKNGNFLGRQLTLSNGSYVFDPSLDNYNIQFDTSGFPMKIICKYPGTDSLVKLDSNHRLIKDINFGLSCNSEFDLGVTSILTKDIVFPGRKHNLYINAGDLSQIYGFSCANGVSGSLSITVSGKVKYVGPSSLSLSPDTIKGSTFIYNIKDFGKMGMKFGLEFLTDTNASIMDEVCVDAVITASKVDKNIWNNRRKHCYKVVNSLDPNIKEVYPVNVPGEYNDWLTYTVHFQNTGTAPAFNIRIADTLDKNLDPETFTLLDQSHTVEVNQKGRALSFRFREIMLPDSHTNSPASNGYVQYKIKPKYNLPLGTKINNTAFIYFDYNEPVVTNTTINEYVDFNSSFDYRKMKSIIKTYPNPSSGKVIIAASRDFELTVMDFTGKRILQTRNASEVVLGTGIYFFEYLVDGVKMVEKVIVLCQ